MCLYFLITVFSIKGFVSGWLKQVSRHPQQSTVILTPDREIENITRIYEQIKFKETIHY